MVRRGFDIQGLISPGEADLLQKFAREQQDKFKSDLLEIGSWKGRSSVVIASVLKEDHRLWMIDHFRGKPSYKTKFKRRGEPWAYPEVLENVIKHKIQNNVIVLPLSSQLAANIGLNEKFCFIFIDGNHTYEGVSRDWQLWSPHLEIGGVCLFHDCHYPPIQKFLEELKRQKDLKVETRVRILLAIRRLK